MSKDISITFSLKDRFTDQMKNILTGQKRFDSSLKDTSSRMQSLYEKKHMLTIDNKAADKAIKDTMKNTKLLDNELRDSLRPQLGNKAQLSMQLKEVNKQISDLGKKKANPEIKLKDNASKNLDDIKSKIGSIGKWVGLAGVGLAVGAGVGLIGIVKQSVSLAANMEQSRIAFETMLGSQDKSDKFLNSLMKFAIDTPYEFNQLTDASKKMLAYGFTLEEVIPTLTAVGNASSGLGLGAEGVDRITLALGQMLAKQKVTGDEMRQLTEAGVPAWDILAKATGKTAAEVMKLSEKGVIPADKAIKALIKGMNTRFPDMMIRQSKTLLGLWSSLKDFVNLNLFGAFGEGIRQGVMPYLTKFVDMLTKNEGGLDKIKTKLMDVGKTAGDFVGKNLDSLLKYFEKTFNNPVFQNADLGGKIKFVLDDMYNGMQTWFDGDGGTKIKEVFKTGMDNAVEITIVALTKYIPEFTSLGLQMGSAMADGMVSALLNKIPGYEALNKMGGNPLPTLNKVPGTGLLFLLGLGGLATDKMKNNSVTSEGHESWYNGHSRAIGVNRVPYNNYPILAHEGEKLLTKQEANSYGKGSIFIAKLAETLVIREEADIMKIAKEFARQLELARLNFGGVN